MSSCMPFLLFVYFQRLFCFISGYGIKSLRTTALLCDFFVGSFHRPRPLSTVPLPSVNLKSSQDYNILSLSVSVSLRICVSLYSSTLWFSKSIFHWRLKCFSECFANPPPPPPHPLLLPPPLPPHPLNTRIASGKWKMSCHWFMCR